jgi:transcriptional regulator with XRE-family HTH domain
MPTANRVTAIMRDVVKRLPVSVSALAREVGMAQSVLWRILNGERPATAARVDKIAAALESWGKDATAVARALRRAIRTQGRTR